LKLIEKNKVEYAIIYGLFIGFKLKGKSTQLFTHRSMLSDSDLLSLFKEYKVRFSNTIVEDRTIFALLFGFVMPVLVMTFWMSYLTRQNSKQPQLIEEDKSGTLFKDIGGHEYTKERLKEIIEYIKEPEKYVKLGIRPPKGVLFHGPPGTGKTLLAKALANEWGIPFLYNWGSDFVEIFVGQGPKRVRDLFQQARQHKKCIIFIDEIDSLGYERNKHSLWKEADNTLNQLLAEMDGFAEARGITVIGATNQVDILDPALLRPGRFDWKIPIHLPNKNERIEILKIHLSKRAIEVGEDAVDIVADKTSGFNGSELESLVNEASFIAMRRAKNNIGGYVMTDDDLIKSLQLSLHSQEEINKSKQSQKYESLQNFYQQFLFHPQTLNK
jgi:cell division protease FtsH